MIAVRKFLGACLENVNRNGCNLEAVVGGMAEVTKAMDQVGKTQAEQDIVVRSVANAAHAVKAVEKLVQKDYDDFLALTE